MESCMAIRLDRFTERSLETLTAYVSGSRPTKGIVVKPERVHFAKTHSFSWQT